MILPNQSSITAVVDQQVSTNESALDYTFTLDGDETSHPEIEPSTEIRPSLKPRPGQGFGPSKREVMQLDQNGEPIKVNKKDLDAVELVKSLVLTPRGWSALSNRILDILYQADFTKAELEIILFIIRESIFWQREWTKPLSGSDFEMESGISRSSLWSHLKRLTDRNWIEKSLTMPEAPGRKQFCNQYRLNPLAWGELLPKKKLKIEEEERQESDLSQKPQPNQESNTPPDLNSRSGSQSENRTTSSLYKNILLNTDLKTSLSQAPKELEARWIKMADQGKYERKIFLNLFKTFGQSVWDHCAEVVQYLSDHGDLRKKPVASPFGLLSQGNNWELFLGLTLKRKQNEEAIKEARQAPALIDQVAKKSTQESTKASGEEFTNPPADFNTRFKTRSYGISQNTFKGEFVTMEDAFKSKFSTQSEQWSEIDIQLGTLAESIDNDRAKWIAGVQRWFHGAWNLGQIAQTA